MTTGLLGADGRPIHRETSSPDGRRAVTKSILGSADGYMRSLAALEAPAQYRARDPFSNHAWVFAAAIITAVTAGQAPLVVMRETDATMTRRREATKSTGRAWTGPRAGVGRRSVQRYIDLPLEKRLSLKAAEPDYEHPVMDLLMRPNPMQDGWQLLAVTLIWMCVRGEVFWVQTDESGEPIVPGETPTQLWCVGPDAFRPILANGSCGELVAWKFCPPAWMPCTRGVGQVMVIDRASVIQHKFPNPMDPLRGLSRVSAAAHGIRLDMLINGHQSNLLAKSGVPRLALTSKEPIDPKDEAEFMAQWKRTYGGEFGDAVAMLSGGLDITEISFSPADMGLLELGKENRDTILAVMGVPPSKLGVTEFVNYATSMSEDLTFWSSTILPMLRLIERGCDGSLMFTSTDNLFLMFDLSGIDALRAGITSKIDDVKKLVAQDIHMPPKDAFALVGMEVPAYNGDDVSLIGGMMTTLDATLEAASLPIVDPVPPAPPANEQTPPADPQASDPQSEEPSTAEPTPTGKTLESARRILVYSGPRAKARAGKRWKEFLRLEVGNEKAMIVAYRKWVLAERKATLDRFDAVAGKHLMRMLAAHLKDSTIDLTAVLPDPDDSGNKLKGISRPVRTGTMHSTYEFTLDDIGIPTFEVDDPKLHKFFDLREQKFVSTTPRTIIGNLRSSLTEGFKTGETVQQLRTRVAQVYDVASSSSKALTVARTETANFMNGVRDQMFDLQGFEEEDWVTAGDENVRDSHQTYGAAGAQKRGFNYLSLTGGSGQLRYPGDLEAPASEVVNCRCMKVPVG